MPHLRLQVPQEWLTPEFIAGSGFDAKTLLDHLVQLVAGLRMPNPAIEKRRQELESAAASVSEASALVDGAGKPIPAEVPFINLSNLKHAIEPLHYAHVAGDPGQRFLHVTLAAGNDTPGRSAQVRSQVALTIGDAIDDFLAPFPLAASVTSVTVWVQDIDRDRGYTTTADRKKRRAAQSK